MNKSCPQLRWKAFFYCPRHPHSADTLLSAWLHLVRKQLLGFRLKPRRVPSGHPGGGEGGVISRQVRHLLKSIIPGNDLLDLRQHLTHFAMKAGVSLPTRPKLSPTALGNKPPTTRPPFGPVSVGRGALLITGRVTVVIFHGNEASMRCKPGSEVFLSAAYREVPEL